MWSLCIDSATFEFSYPGHPSVDNLVSPVTGASAKAARKELSVPNSWILLGYAWRLGSLMMLHCGRS